MSGLEIQEVIALLLVLFAAAYIVRELTGFPKKTKRTKPVAVGERLARGLEASKENTSKPPTSDD